MEEKQLSLSVVKNLLMGKYLHVEGEYTIWEGVVHTVSQDDVSSVYIARYGVCYAVSLTNADVRELGAKGKTGSVFLFNDREDCLNKIRRIREYSAETNTDVWKERWWDVFFLLLKISTYSEYTIETTNNIITDAMKGIDDFFKTLEK